MSEQAQAQTARSPFLAQAGRVAADFLLGACLFGLVAMAAVVLARLMEETGGSLWLILAGSAACVYVVALRHRSGSRRYVSQWWAGFALLALIIAAAWSNGA